MDKEKVTKLLKSIANELGQLAKETEAKHISAFVIDDRIYISDYTNIEKPKFDYYNGKYGEEIKINE